MQKEWEEEKLREFSDRYTALTIPVLTSIEAQQRVFDLESIKKVLSRAELIAVQECYCRTALGNCDNPRDVCLSLNTVAAEVIGKYGGREIPFEEALALLEVSHKAGLVHLAYSAKGDHDITYVCSCCSCCCHHMNALKKLGYHEIIVKSDYKSKFEKSLCTSCGLCVERCQFGAWSQSDDGVELDEEACFGCGLCVSSCPSGALSLIRR